MCVLGEGIHLYIQQLYSEPYVHTSVTDQWLILLYMSVMKSLRNS